MQTARSDSLRQTARTTADGAPPAETDVVVVGSGFAGLGMAIRLKQAGRDDFVVLERAAEVGGTWRDNTYPGCMCDVPSNLYSFSFAPKPDWTCTYPAQPEIWAYLRDCADRFAVRSHIRFNAPVTDATWDESRRRWRIRSGAGEVSAPVLVLAVGPLSEPRLPDIPGIESFAGTAFHSAAWDHGHDLSGERVAVVGTGATAIQIVPSIQPRVAHLDVYQRTPPWVLPHPNRALHRAERWLARRAPVSQRVRRAGIYAARELLVLGFAFDRRFTAPAERAALRHMARQVPDSELRRRLTPKYRLGCKRILISNDYYPALTQPNVTVITDGIRQIRPHAVVTDASEERATDTIVFATGFHVTDTPIAAHVHGRGGMSLEAAWAGSPHAYKGTSVPGFPNMFFLAGPNTGLGHTSLVYMIEAQLEHVMRCLREMAQRDADVIEVRPEAETAYNTVVQERMRGTVWTTGGCASWYIDRSGRNSALWPTFTFSFRRRVLQPDVGAYRFQAA